jgi:hypothetical protein
VRRGSRAAKQNRIAAASWGRNHAFFDVPAVELDPTAAQLDEGVRFPICSPVALEALFTSAGLGQVEVSAIDIPTPFANFEDYWQPFLGGQGPAPTYLMSLHDDARDRLRDCIRERIPTTPGGSISLTARVWAIRGSVVSTDYGG